MHTHKLGLSSDPGTGLYLFKGTITSGCHYLSAYVPGTVLAF